MTCDYTPPVIVGFQPPYSDCFITNTTAENFFARLTANWLKTDPAAVIVTYPDGTMFPMQVVNLQTFALMRLKACQ